MSASIRNQGLNERQRLVSHLKKWEGAETMQAFTEV